MGRKKAAAKAGNGKGSKKPRLTGAKKYAIARVLLSGIPANHLAQLFGVSQISVYNWGKAVKKAGGKNPFDEATGELTPHQKRLLAIAKRTK